MKEKFIREFVPFMAAGIIISVGYLCNKNSAEGKVTEIKHYFPKYNDGKMYYEELEKNKTILLNLGENPKTINNIGHPLLQYETEYEAINSNDIECISYNVEKTSMVIKMKDSSVCYYGKFDIIKKQYIYEKIGEEMTIISKQNTKKM